MAETSNDLVEALQGMIRSQLLDVNTCMPGTIVSYANGLARVQPVGKKRFADGDALDYPVIPNVRVCWPSFAGGAAGVKGPVKPGDNCLLVIAQQAVDGSDDRRMFDLSDAYAVMCDVGNAGAGDSGNNDTMTMFFGAAFIKLTASGQLLINAPGGTVVTTPSLSNSGTLSNAGAVNMASTLDVAEQVTAPGGVNIGGIEFATHGHTNVQNGPDTSGGPV